MKCLCNFCILILIVLLPVITFAETTWTTPDSISDIMSAWTNELNIIDSNQFTQATTTTAGKSYSGNLVIIPPPIVDIGGTDYLLCNKIRFDATFHGVNQNKYYIEITIPGDSEVKEKQGFSNHMWQEIVFVDEGWGENLYVSLASVRFYNNSPGSRPQAFWEFDFGAYTPDETFDARLNRSLDTWDRRGRYDF